MGYQPGDYFAIEFPVFNASGIQADADVPPTGWVNRRNASTTSSYVPAIDKLPNSVGRYVARGTFPAGWSGRDSIAVGADLVVGGVPVSTVIATLVLDDPPLTAAAVWAYATRTLSAKAAATLAAADVTGSLPATITDKAGFKLAADGLDAIDNAEVAAVPTNFRQWLRWLCQHFATATKTPTQIRTRTSSGATATTQAITDDGQGNQTLGYPS